LLRPIIKSYPQEKACVSWGRGASQNLGISCNISAMATGSDFKISMQLGFAKAHNNISSGRRSGRERGLRELPKILEFQNLMHASVYCSKSPWRRYKTCLHA